ncbi:ECA oligosaccharide polymerase [Glaesserella parasuis]|uniref:ECA oligosaccharide polymerase n=1 Tax=Glaesserella parasuis TaxID=738 RepID=UPI0003AC399B|nr:ECA oligosaccharide polymerase [Glaesserella parasuis]AIK16442.1 polymerase [Glaesserella parasuis]ATW44885.1 enterobacterial common antigen polymerase [Glaesserella parasuis str. Nagasaki]EQA02436.1 wzyE family protein [Glaesserella parasuis str. Nagasaki]EYE72323.1 putative common antigen polymerase [Glaesserella parasuis str. Nagasaki]MCT8546566.1 ECA oligosaccharide polymerase [Glaesserella parasuis]
MLAGLILFYVIAISVLVWIIQRDYRQQGFSFHLLFSGIYLITFFGGFPFSMTMAGLFEYRLPVVSMLWNVLAIALGGYLIYYVSYLYIGRNKQIPRYAVEVKSLADLTAWILMMIAILSLLGFMLLNQGLLLFKLEKYSHIFSAQVSGVALKRFFYFFLPALLIWFFLKPTKESWWLFLVAGMTFGVLSYLAVGGTRANLALAFVMFMLLGYLRRFLSFKWLVRAGLLTVIAMFLLALWRYRLNVQGSEAFYTFLYLTRDTFSPWENVAKIMDAEIEFQGLMPIVRDFYVYIPQSLWEERPDIVWNTANYFTKSVLGNFSGLAMSPTLLGSFYIMGGIPMIAIGMAVVGGLIRIFDNFFAYGKNSAVIQSYCLANLFNLIVLIREGIDAFISRFCFFSVIFVFAYIVAYLINRVREWYE